MSSSVEWCSLPAELLQTIAESITNITDYIRFRSVCRSWRAAAELHLAFVSQEFPQRRLLLNQSHYGHPLPEPSAGHHRWIGDYLGCVTLIDDPIFLIENEASLPPLSTLPGCITYDAFKQIYMQSPFFNPNRLSEMRHKLVRGVFVAPNCLDPNKFSAYAISFKPPGTHNLALACCRRGDPSWRRIDDHTQLGTYEEAIDFRGKVYLVNSCRRALTLCDFNVHYVTGDERIGVGGHVKYLVDVKGDLLLVERYLDWGRQRGYRMPKFRVFEFTPRLR